MYIYIYTHYKFPITVLLLVLALSVDYFKKNEKDVPLVEFMYAVYLHAYQVRVTVGNSGLVVVLYLCYLCQVLINSLGCRYFTLFK